MVFHVQLQWRSWLQEQISSDTHRRLPDFCTGLRTLEHQNNLAWFPSCANVPACAAPNTPTKSTTCNGRGGGGAGVGSGSRGGGNGGGGDSVSGGTTAPGGAPTGNENPVPAQVRIINPARRREFTGNSAMATNMRTRRVTDA
jgi:hypothetical protein